MAEWAAQAPAFGLVFARCGGLLALAPPLGTRQFPLALRLGLAAVLAAALAPVAELTPQVGAVTICEYSALLVREAAIGLATGFAAALVFHAFTVAGGLLDSFLGAGSATQRAEGIGPLATLSWTLAAAVFVAIDGHHLVIRALAEGLRVLPVGGPVAAGELAAMADAVRAMLGAGVQIALRGRGGAGGLRPAGARSRARGGGAAGALDGGAAGFRGVGAAVRGAGVGAWCARGAGARTDDDAAGRRLR